MGSSFGKKSDVGDISASLGSSQRIQSPKVPKSNDWPLVSSLGSEKEFMEKSIESGEVGEVSVESHESELACAGSLYGFESQKGGETEALVRDLLLTEK
jgi:hypothetical protein